MLKYLKQYRFYIILFAFVLIPIIAIDTSTRAARDYRFYDKIIVATTSPIQTLISWTLEGIANGFQNYIYLWHTHRDNLLLIEENRRLLNAIVNLKEAQMENARLRNLLGFSETFHIKAIAARVIAKDVSTEFRTIRINRGETDGVRKDMAVLSSEGIVGRVLRTTAKTSDIVTILDLLSAVDVIVKRSRARGIVEGMTDEVCQLKFTLRTDDIQPGDLLISSGQGGIFPKGIPVGTVATVKRETFGISQNVEVRPSADFSRLEEVLVATEFDKTPAHLDNDLRLPSAKETP
jgi:rod shape-determining protein MreC